MNEDLYKEAKSSHLGWWERGYFVLSIAHGIYVHLIYNSFIFYNLNADPFKQTKKRPMGDPHYLYLEKTKCVLFIIIATPNFSFFTY